MTPPDASSPRPPRRDRLFVRLGDGIAFAHYDARQPESFSYYAYEASPAASMAVNLHNALDTVPGDNASTDALVLVAGCPTTLMPLAYFHEEDCEAVYGYCCPGEGDLEVFYDTLPADNAVLLFALRRPLVRILNESFASVRYVAALTPVLRHFAERSRTGGKRLFVYLDGGTTHLAAYDNGRLLMSNSYSVRDTADTVYFALNMARKLGLDVKADPFYVVGRPEAREAAIHALRPYVRQVNPVNPSAEFNRHPAARTEQVPYDLACFLAGLH